jgi:hypothetical protein
VPVSATDLDDDNEIRDQRIIREVLGVVETLANRAHPRSDGAQSSLSPGRHN